MKSPLESRPNERVPSSEEILAAISEHAEGYTVRRELSDEKGVYLLEVEIKGEDGEIAEEYQYVRKGGPRSYNPEYDETKIVCVRFHEGMPVGGEKVAVFNDQTGEWRKV